MSNSNPMNINWNAVDPDPDSICPITKQTHVPDWKTVFLTHDGDDLYVDVNCTDCGRSGCIGTQKTLVDLIDW